MHGAKMYKAAAKGEIEVLRYWIGAKLSAAAIRGVCPVLNLNFRLLALEERKIKT